LVQKQGVFVENAVLMGLEDSRVKGKTGQSVQGVEKLLKDEASSGRKVQTKGISQSWKKSAHQKKDEVVGVDFVMSLGKRPVAGIEILEGSGGMWKKGKNTDSITLSSVEVLAEAGSQPRHQP
jgi:hypothetical protein